MTSQQPLECVRNGLAYAAGSGMLGGGGLVGLMQGGARTSRLMRRDVEVTLTFVLSAGSAGAWKGQGHIAPRAMRRCGRCDFEGLPKGDVQLQAPTGDSTEWCSSWAEMRSGSQHPTCP
eukprot:CAMPEP_0171137372 /NCGR_PEP_ID=MMETSP0766_2-20121228/133245_1 /TAXON_ID=439317 /ORGANISM="Gambierdiscus australes, Strain CAWD 149" /LENGTH=118 /DNA_ID=CAMNT_0011600953 /DNA_START=123 /DNA_END=478 /DNA_ORIENTATION=+